MYSLQDIWNNVIEILSTKLTPTSIKTWFEDCQPVDLNEDVLTLYTPSELKRSVLKQRFDGEIKGALQEMFSCDFNLQILSGDAELAAFNRKRGKSNTENPLPELDGYSFDDFVVGKSNELAYGAARSVAKGPVSKVFNPLFIYGNTGLGKTHLLFAIGTAIQHINPEMKIAFVKGEDFTNQMIRSIKDGTAEEFRQKYRTADILLMDDVQFIAGKEATQQEFYNTYDSLYMAGKQIVITSDRPPSEMALLNERLESRFVEGFMAEIHAPDLETRMAIIRSKAEHQGIQLPEETVAYIAQKVTANARQLEGVVNHLAAYQQIVDARDITQEMVDRSITDITCTVEILPTPDDIISEVSRYYQVPVEQIKGPGRQKSVTTARHVTAYLIRTLTDSVENDIGQFLRHDRSTVHASINRIQKQIASDTRFADTLKDITNNISAQK